MILKRIRIGRHVTISSRTVVSGGSVLEDGVFLEPFSMVPEDAQPIPKGETWGGSPAVPIDRNMISEDHLTSRLGRQRLPIPVLPRPAWSGEDEEDPRPSDAPRLLPCTQFTETTPVVAALPADGVGGAAADFDPSTSVAPVVFRCWMTFWQLAIMVFGTLLAMVVYMPSLWLLVEAMDNIAPGSVPSGSICQATLYCAVGLCAAVPTIDTINLRMVQSADRRCVTERELDSAFFETTAELEILISEQKCKPVQAAASNSSSNSSFSASEACVFPFEIWGTEYTSCTVAPTPDGSEQLPTVAWCITDASSLAFSSVRIPINSFLSLSLSQTDCNSVHSVYTCTVSNKLTDWPVCTMAVCRPV